MSGNWTKFLRALFVVAAVFAAAGPSFAFQEQRYDRKFFIQLRSVFGRFRETDLERAFEKAQAIQCSELVNGEGEWRTVAFFNENRALGDWYRSNFDEVKNDLAAFIFKGVCRGEHGPVQLTTKFPVTESTEAYTVGRIPFDDIAVNINAPVRAAYDAQTQAYSFDLPFLFLVKHADDGDIYSLSPPDLIGRHKYSTDVIDHWDCKSVTAENVTYQFLICRTMTQARNPAMRRAGRGAFGASAYFILSDGKEASSNVRLSFDDGADAKRSVEDVSVAKVPDDGGVVAAWEMPDVDEKIVDIVRDDFRIRFKPESWADRIGSIQVLSSKKVQGLNAPSPQAGLDYCIWQPNTPALASRLLGESPDDPVMYLVTPHDEDSRGPTSVSFKMQSRAGTLGTLQCIFPRVPSVAAVPFNRWSAIVGDHLVLEVRP